VLRDRAGAERNQPSFGGSLCSSSGHRLSTTARVSLGDDSRHCTVKDAAVDSLQIRRHHYLTAHDTRLIGEALRVTPVSATLPAAVFHRPCPPDINVEHEREVPSDALWRVSTRVNKPETADVRLVERIVFAPDAA
jgi:hypothetical protein